MCHISKSRHFKPDNYIIKIPNMATVPIVDFQECGLLVQDFAKVNSKILQSVGKEVVDAFKTYGFCYLKNHGVDKNVVGKYLQASREFFLQPIEEKSKYKINSKKNFGWTKLEGEHLSDNTGELHEVFTYTPLSDYAWPPVDGFETLLKEIFENGLELGHRFIKILSEGLNIPIEFFVNAHKLMGQSGNATATRSLYYPPITQEVEPGKTRLGEHFDHGTVAFTFEDNAGGLEMKTPAGDYLPVIPVEGLLCVHPGIMLQRWTADVILGTPHRIVIPEDEQRRNSDRFSLTFFVMPDDDFPITCIDGSNKYEPLTPRQFLTATYVDQYNG